MEFGEKCFKKNKLIKYNTKIYNNYVLQLININNMKKIYSEDDLLNYIYKEISPQDSLLIEKEINENESLKLIYMELLEGIDLLNKTYFRPSEITLDNIIKKAKEGLKQNAE
jgi:hypothetical protein